MNSDDTEPLISVIVPVYNAEKYLDQCVESILDQTYRNLEVILVDDGSSDSSGQICDAWAAKDQRVLVIHQENRGIAAATNVGLDVSGGDILAFMDDDDWLEPFAYEFLLRQMIEEKADISAGGTWLVEPDRTYSGNLLGVKMTISREEAFKYINAPGYLGVVLWDKLYRRDLFKELRLPSGVTSQDLPVTYELLRRANGIVYDSRPLHFYRLLSSSASHAPRAHLDGLDFTRDMVKYVRETIPSVFPYALYGYLRNAVWAYESIVRLPSPGDDYRDVSRTVEALMRRESRGVSRMLKGSIVRVNYLEQIRWWMIGYTPWLFRPLYRAYVSLRRDRAS